MLIGDNLTDIQAARAAGIGRALLLAAAAPADAGGADQVVATLAQAQQLLFG